MLITAEEAKLFFSLYPSLIGYAAARSGGIGGIADGKSFKAAPREKQGEARDHLLENMNCISEFVEENPDGFREQELSHVLDWSRFIRGNFFIERDLKNYTVFLRDDNPPKAYGVLGLADEISHMVPLALPIMVEAVLLPWQGRIVCDGLISFYNMYLGGGIQTNLRETYRKAKASGIITSLDPDWKPEVPKPARKPKTPAIARFLKKKCPKTVAEFKKLYGEPSMEVNGSAAYKLTMWSIDGHPVIDTDYLMIYPNIIRHQVLYVYAKDKNIISISAVDRTDWDRSDLKPPAGHRLMS